MSPGKNDGMTGKASGRAREWPQANLEEWHANAGSKSDLAADCRRHADLWSVLPTLRHLIEADWNLALTTGIIVLP
jgi:hypothetical protein